MLPEKQTLLNLLNFGERTNMKTSIIVNLDKTKETKQQKRQRWADEAVASEDKLYEDKFHYDPFNEQEPSLIDDETSQEVDTEVDSEL